MRIAWIARAGAAIALPVLLVLAVGQALAASQLTGVQTLPGRNGGARLFLSFAGGVPRGWAVEGAGTQTPSIFLPGTNQAPSVNQIAYAGTGALSSVSLASSNGGILVTLHLTNPLQIITTASSAAIAVDIAPPLSTPTTPAPAAASQPPPQAGENYEIVPLKYADVSEVVGLLVQGQQVQPNDVFTPEGSIFALPTSTNTSSGFPSGSNSSPFSASNNGQETSLGERVNDNVGYDRRLNAVVLYGSADQIAEYKRFIAQVDVPSPSVMLECAVVELDETSAHDLGLDFTGEPNGPVATGSATLGSVNTTTGLTTPQFGANFQASLYATISHGGGRILATPRVLAINGTPAQILSGDALPIVSTIVSAGATTITQTNVNYIAVGINMQIQPRIDTTGYVTSHIYAEVSSVTQYIETAQGQVPQISLRQVSTEATVKDGTPFIVGGLLLDEEISNLSKVPGIGDLPIIGGLFRVRHDSVQRSNLYILITPHIIRQIGVTNPGAQIEQLPAPAVPGPIPSYPPP